MDFIDFFSGIGGFRLGMEAAGHRCVGFCEYDKWATMSYTAMHLITEEQREHLLSLPMKERQREILKDEYRSGEWYARDIRSVNAAEIPGADAWCFGFPCQDISVAGKQVGFYGNRSSLFFRVMYLVEQMEEEKKPTYLFAENVKNLLSVNGGWDFARLLSEMDAAGYDASWEVLDSRDFGVPQHRERVFIVGYLRGRSAAKVLPVERADGKNNICEVRQIGQIYGTEVEKNPSGGRIYDATCEGTAMRTLGSGHGMSKPYMCQKIEVIGNTRLYKGEPKGDCDRVFAMDGLSGALKASDYKDPKKVAIPVLSPKIANKQQNGRRFKEEGDPSFTLTSRDRHGVAIGVEAAVGADGGHHGMYVTLPGGVTAYAVWYPKSECYVVVRNLTPRECFRLQGFPDEMFERAELVNTNSQLYKQAGNAVTVPVIAAIARKLGKA